MKKIEWQEIIKNMERIGAALVRIEKKIDKMAAYNPISESNQQLTVKAAATYLSLSPSRVYFLSRTGRLRSLQTQKRGRLLFARDDLNKYLLGNFQSKNEQFQTKQNKQTEQ